MSEQQQDPIMLARLLSQRLGISVSSDEAPTLHENLMQMLASASQASAIYAAIEERKACERIAVLSESAEHCAAAIRARGQQ